MKLVKKHTEIVIDKIADPENQTPTAKEIIDDEITITNENNPTLVEIYKLLKAVLMSLAGYQAVP